MNIVQITLETITCFREHLRDIEKHDTKSSKTIARHFSLPSHSRQHVTVCDLSLHQGSSESRKTLNKNLFLKSALLILTVSTNAFHSTHNSSIRSDKGLTLETSASESIYGGQFTLSTQLIKPDYFVILPPTQHHSFFRNLLSLLACIVWSACVMQNLHTLSLITLLITESG